MTDENGCELGKWKLFIRFLERNKTYANWIIGTACVCVFISVAFTFYYGGKGIQEAAKILTLKASEMYGK